MSKTIKIAGIGPGHPDYISPAALAAIHHAQVLIGGKRLLNDYAQPHQQLCVIDKNLPTVLDFILNQPMDQEVAVLVSGDPGFFSMAHYLKSRLPNLKFEYIPGISSVQYMFARLQEPWQGARFFSLHGRQEPPLGVWAASTPVVALLTGGEWSPQAISRCLLEQVPDRRTAIGVNLSYPDEKVFFTTFEALARDGEDYSNSVMVVFNEQ